MPKWILSQANDLVLLHLENNATNSGIIPITLSDTGNKNVGYGTAKFGSYSLFVDTKDNTPGTTDSYLSNASYEIPAFRYGRWTVDFWFKWVGSSGAGTKYFFTMFNGSDTMNVAINPVTGSLYYAGESSTTSSFSSFTHIAIVHDDDSYTRVYVNGIKEIDAVELTNTRTDCRIYVGNFQKISASYYIDEFRVCDAAKWTSNFTPPTQAYIQ